MKQRIHLELIKLMAINGVGSNFDVVPFIAKNFVFEYNVANKSIHSGRIMFFIDDLVNRGFIENDDGKDYGAWRNDEVNGKMIISFSNEKLFYRLTSKGLDYLDESEASKISKLANYSIIVSLIITLIFSIFTGVTSYLTFEISNKTYAIAQSNYLSDSVNSIKTEKRLDTLLRELPILRKTLTSAINKGTSPKQAYPTQ
ncbi:hypothetical protein IM792_02945 [Mucilaginibacter sp. JRF]|uniref:hypothetical protein n=1 Tax=Mucilaginibacter sp. JRF TaxID=2780088 RepID=UPI00187EC79F|nr:hypothetical protein [Mucilaginibacter sp. JRF]MBE9583393.1 hypothetical protein [Mucilaginibacter sp. JRF]